MKFLKSKTAIIAIVVILVIVLIYFYLEGSTVPAGGLQENTASSDVGASVLSLLNQVQSLRIDTSLFNDNVYKSLSDDSVQINPEPVGRANPFAPLTGIPNEQGTQTGSSNQQQSAALQSLSR